MEVVAGRSSNNNNKRSVLGDGDQQQSSLFDQFERDAFEAHLNQALLLGRSLSAPNDATARPRHQLLLPNPPDHPFFLVPFPQQEEEHQQQPRRRSIPKLSKALKKLLKLFLLRKCRRVPRGDVPDADDLKVRRAFSRSCRA